MKYATLLLASMAFATLTFAQNLGIGAKMTGDWVNQESFNENPTYLNYGLTLDFGLGDNIAFNLDAVHSSRKFEERVGGILTAADVIDSSTSEYVADFTEKVFEFSAGLRLKLLGNAIVSPFVGGGAVMQLPYGYSGVRELVSTSGRVEDFELDTFKESSKALFGAYPSAGFYINLGDRFSMLGEMRYKFYFDSNYRNYVYTSISSIVEENHTALEGGLAVILKF